MKKKIIISWVLAIIITLGAAYYQRKTGPSYEKKVIVDIRGNSYKFKLERSHSSSSDYEIKLPIADNSVRGFIIFRKYPTHNKWDTVAMKRSGNVNDILFTETTSRRKVGILFYFSNRR